MEEKLREYCSIGDEENVRILVERGANFNSAHKINGWTALHWAAKRNHKNIVKYLIKIAKADTTVKNNKGELAADLTTDQEIRTLLGAEGSPLSVSQKTLPIVPNYLKNPDFFYSDNNSNFEIELKPEDENPRASTADPSKTSDESKFRTSNTNLVNTGVSQDETSKRLHCCFCHHITTLSPIKNAFCEAEDDLVIKLRISDSDDKDFIEVDMKRKNLTFVDFFELSCKELGIQVEKVKKIRKLPNTILRNDKDISRLQQFQEIEVVLLQDHDASKVNS